MLGERVVPLAEVHVAHDPLGVDEVFGGPVLIVVGVPGPVVVVHRDGVAHAEGLDRGLHVAHDVLELEFGRLHSYHDQTIVLVALVPGLDVRQGSLTVDARIRPEVHEDDLAAKLGHGERPVAGGVEPRGDVREVRCRTTLDQRCV